MITDQIPRNRHNLMFANHAPLLTSDYLNHFGELVMLLEMLPDMPEAIDDARAWRPRSYQSHLGAMTWSSTAQLRMDFERLEPHRREMLDEASANANRLGSAIVAALQDDRLSPERLSGVVHLGCGAMHAHIRRLSAILAGLSDIDVEMPSCDAQAQIDAVLAA